MILKRKDITKNMIVRTFDNHEYRITEELKKSNINVSEGNTTTLMKQHKAINTQTGNSVNLTQVYYKIRTVHNLSKTKIIAKRKHSNSELKVVE